MCAEQDILHALTVCLKQAADFIFVMRFYQAEDTIHKSESSESASWPFCGQR